MRVWQKPPTTKLQTFFKKKYEVENIQFACDIWVLS